MPTYQYRCTECGNDLEAVQKFSDPALTECPTCHGHLRKVYNAVGVVFKGSGFYRTDSRGKEAAADGPKTSGHETKVSDGASNGSSEKSGKPATDSGSSSGTKTDGAKTPAKAGAGSSTGSGSSS